MLEFIGRGALTSDLCGEKLSEAFVLGVLRPLQLKFALLLPLERGYALVVDGDEVAPRRAPVLARCADEALCANPQYAYARKLGQLRALQVRRCVAPLARWQTHALAQGRRLGDLKPPVLSARTELAGLFDVT